MQRFALVALALVAGAGCSFIVSTDGLAGPGEAINVGIPEGGAPDAGEAGTDAATLEPACPHPHGVSTTAAWAIRGGCVSRNGRGRVVGPTTASRARTFTMAVPPGKGTFAVYSEVAIAADGTMFIGAEDELHGVRAYSGNGGLFWEATTSNSDAITIGADGFLYSGTGLSVTSLQAATGATRWNRPRGSEIDTSIALAKNGDVFYGTYDGRVEALTKDGDERWTAQAAAKDDRIYPIALGPTGVLYVSSSNDALVALDPKDGHQLWKYELGADGFDMPSVDDAGNIYVGTIDSAVHSVDANGVRRWRVDIAAGKVSTPSIARDGTVYAASEGGKLRALDPKDGRELWARDLPGGVVGQPLIDAEGSLYVATGTTGTPQLRVFAADGTPRFNADLGQPARNTPSFAPSGALVIALGNGEVRVFER